jgi:hypothetical protein
MIGKAVGSSVLEIPGVDVCPVIGTCWTSVAVVSEADCDFEKGELQARISKRILRIPNITGKNGLRKLFFIVHSFCKPVIDRDINHHNKSSWVHLEYCFWVPKLKLN